ncbi:MAG: hypothetical protein A2509_02755 [Candidatus Edwardsbacteria bacterium RIFOXYD12_FULL_50_11]|uniref:Uncharacterized protein n=1 Tax=Candidatus Edwardsbacteria bacterium GWF2_54_11 TaxID=1817851 RepID=A0A1F5RIA4_9BACT|nr:MAG: hypothetical protein A2502_06620 [Candidatus Edwardsbacteria bacterium RifOxyC12_full_54_24]OGF07030.1 MAG: hypothetical protein A2273_08810 [Candidatus Edwardsbacteria bacterium RifOxyA12_full_54_48]OGF11004.1 MAG: hypothetical protein A3K15_07700 [Candidatus Edwardsbacteria bacterium GWE2_54_12]OGF14094.1 MAG: hypothetical protein A2024_06075 [Candidatus Edwardsbacteria bacterium GWF2_54_11]OGF15950.1 MAG: hypothetical protein A2509_02755 [Candidatus Edwardsbacteria bacterium RIFOXYD1
MPVKTSRTIAAQLNSAQVAVSNALADAGMLKLLAEYGYTAARIKEGQKLYEAARLAVNAHKSLVGSQQDKTAKVKKVTKKAYDAYQALAKVARAIWLKDKARLAALGLQGKMPKTTAGFLTAAYILFDNAAKGGLAAASNPTGLLGDYGYTTAKLTAERAKIAELDKINQAQEAAKGMAQDAARAQDKALKALAEWLARFVKIAKVALRDQREYLEKLGVLARTGKTKAQRAAAAKASATKKAKKSGA